MAKKITEMSNMEIYLEYVNNWLTVEKMVEHYGVPKKWMKDKVTEARK